MQSATIKVEDAVALTGSRNEEAFLRPRQVAFTHVVELKAVNRAWVARDRLTIFGGSEQYKCTAGEGNERIDKPVDNGGDIRCILGVEFAMA